jgi:hypothetical protein
MEVDEREIELRLRLGELDLGLEEAPLRVEHLDVARVAVVVAQARDAIFMVPLPGDDRMGGRRGMRPRVLPGSRASSF